MRTFNYNNIITNNSLTDSAKANTNKETLQNTDQEIKTDIFLSDSPNKDPEGICMYAEANPGCTRLRESLLVANSFLFFSPEGIPMIEFRFHGSQIAFRSDIENAKPLSNSKDLYMNSVYPGALINRKLYRGCRWAYERDSNNISWMLASLNPCLFNDRGKLQYAVMVWRNTSRFLNRLSRHTRMLAKTRLDEAECNHSSKLLREFNTEDPMASRPPRASPIWDSEEDKSIKEHSAKENQRIKDGYMFVDVSLNRIVKPEKDVFRLVRRVELNMAIVEASSSNRKKAYRRGRYPYIQKNELYLKLTFLSQSDCNNSPTLFQHTPINNLPVEEPNSNTRIPLYMIEQLKIAEKLREEEEQAKKEQAEKKDQPEF